MYKPGEMDGTPIIATIRLQRKYREYWRSRSDWYWLWRLLQEFTELGRSLLGLHKDPARWELMQIAAICLNWMYKIDAKGTLPDAETLQEKVLRELTYSMGMPDEKDIVFAAMWISLRPDNTFSSTVTTHHLEGFMSDELRKQIAENLRTLANRVVEEGR